MGLWKIVGTKSTVQWALIRISSKIHLNWPESWRVHPRQLQQELLVRLRGTSDINVFNQIFIRQEYSSLRNLENVLMVLDLGANVGYSSAYFLSCFRNSRVVAVEPDERNVAVCKVNLEPYGDRVQLLRGAVWSERTALSWPGALSAMDANGQRRWCGPPTAMTALYRHGTLAV